MAAKKIQVSKLRKLTNAYLLGFRWIVFYPCQSVTFTRSHSEAMGDIDCHFARCDSEVCKHLIRTQWGAV